MKVLKVTLILLLTFVFANLAIAQELVVNLPLMLRADKVSFEFSSLALWNSGLEDYVVLTPTLKGKTHDNSKCIYAIAAKDIKNSILTHEEVNAIPIFIDSRSYNKIIGNILGYGGIEGTAIVGNHIYFSVECDYIECFVVKGTLSKDSVGNLNVVLEETCKIEKPRDAGPNDGFESITYLPKENKLLVVFEKEYGRKTTKAYKIDLSLKNVNEYRSFPAISRRMPDLVADKDDKLICISSEEKRNPNLIIVTNNKASIPVKTNLDISLNWEGITLFENGVLMINDNCMCPGGMVYQTKLSFFKLE